MVHHPERLACTVMKLFIKLRKTHKRPNQKLFAYLLANKSVAEAKGIIFCVCLGLFVLPALMAYSFLVYFCVICRFDCDVTNTKVVIIVFHLHTSRASLSLLVTQRSVISIIELMSSPSHNHIIINHNENVYVEVWMDNPEPVVSGN